VESYRYTAIDISQVGRDEVNEARPIAWLSYVSILFLVPLLAMRGNRFALFHARQGMILFAYKVGVILASVVLSVVFIGVDYVDAEPKALAYLQEFDITYPNGPDVGQKISNAYHIKGVPETFYVDKRGQLRGVKMGPLFPPELDDVIDELLAE